LDPDFNSITRDLRAIHRSHLDPIYALMYRTRRPKEIREWANKGISIVSYENENDLLELLKKIKKICGNKNDGIIGTRVQIKSDRKDTKEKFSRNPSLSETIMSASIEDRSRLSVIEEISKSEHDALQSKKGKTEESDLVQLQNMLDRLSKDNKVKVLIDYLYCLVKRGYQ
jgi:16S rRNA C1402 (ribose-2'-O) methylase RsmI